jgi:type IV pilus assembly protein PilO
MKKFTFKQQLVILIFFLVLTLVLFFVFGWRPQVKRLAEINKEKIEQEKKLKEARLTVARLKQAEKEASQMQVELIKLSNKMPPEPDIPTLIVELQDIANDSGVDIKSFNPTEPKMNGDYGELNLNLSAQGTFMEITNFIYHLESAIRAYKINSLSIAPADYPELRFDLQATTYILPLKDGEKSDQTSKPVVKVTAPAQEPTGETKTGKVSSTSEAGG